MAEGEGLHHTAKKKKKITSCHHDLTLVAASPESIQGKKLGSAGPMPVGTPQDGPSDDEIRLGNPGPGTKFG